MVINMFISPHYYISFRSCMSMRREIITPGLKLRSKSKASANGIRFACASKNVMACSR